MPSADQAFPGTIMDDLPDWITQPSGRILSIGRSHLHAVVTLFRLTVLTLIRLAIYARFLNGTCSKVRERSYAYVVLMPSGASGCEDPIATHQSWDMAKLYLHFTLAQFLDCVFDGLKTLLGIPLSDEYVATPHVHAVSVTIELGALNDSYNKTDTSGPLLFLCGYDARHEACLKKKTLQKRGLVFRQHGVDVLRRRQWRDATVITRVARGLTITIQAESMARVACRRLPGTQSSLAATTVPKAPNMQSMYPTASGSGTALYGLGISDVAFGPQSFPSSHSLPDVALTGADRDRDMNSPEAFRHNIHLVHQQVLRIQSLARSALVEIEHAYHPRRSPTPAYMVALKQALQTLVDQLRQSGVGALPLMNPTDPLPTEETLMADLEKSIKHEYDDLKRLSSDATVVFNLLNVAEQGLRR
ncbi:hypothetical protein NM688_g2319 [Phlebia brevispora]|uniref:Uncharacterized protein n=1 Tax=Phlebia brevispora TaxID=194682 RepID=A0ACC1T976_9APHY|nr:hypothetical protein NM688_g2319 [Phlebia brevispora]